jgi:hypothetical protein
MRDCYKEKPRTQAVTRQVLRQAIGPRFFRRYKGTLSEIVASEIIYDDVSDFLPKEIWDAPRELKYGWGIAENSERGTCRDQD